jgi:hypothetical protein
MTPPLSPADIVSRIIPGVHWGDIDLAGDDLSEANLGGIQ